MRVVTPGQRGGSLTTGWKSGGSTAPWSLSVPCAPTAQAVSIHGAHQVTPVSLGCGGADVYVSVPWGISHPLPLTQELQSPASTHKGVTGWLTSLLEGSRASLAQTVKNLPAMQETRFNPWVGKIPWRRDWQPSPVFLPGQSHGKRSPGKVTIHGVTKSLDWVTNTFSRIKPNPRPAHCSKCCLLRALAFTSLSGPTEGDILQLALSQPSFTSWSEEPPCGHTG